jgi:hypothetical protein
MKNKTIIFLSQHLFNIIVEVLASIIVNEKEGEGYRLRRKNKAYVF